MFIMFTEAPYLKRVFLLGCWLTSCSLLLWKETFIAVVTEAPLGRVQALRGEFFQFPLAYRVQEKNDDISCQTLEVTAALVSSCKQTLADLTYS